MRPLLSFFAAQEIPAALVTFVSLLIFIQTGTSPALSTFYSALLLLPWVAKRWFKRRLATSYSYRQLLISELCIVLTLFFVSMMLSPSSSFFASFNQTRGAKLFFALLLLAALTAWHVVQSDYYYHQVVRWRRLRLYYSTPRLIVSQSMVVATYGVLIILVGALQVYTHSIYVSWAAGFKILAGVFLLFVLWHSLPVVLGVGFTRRRNTRAYDAEMVHASLRAKGQFLNRTAPVSSRKLLLLFLLLLPQSLMFYTRVLYLLAPVGEGGLSRSIQEVGFAHGVVGALAFCVGLVISRSTKDVRSPFGCVLLLSPVVYLLMTFFPPTWLWQLCLCTMVSQFAFGYGLHNTLTRLGFFAMSGLRSPFVALSMLVPVALSGWLVQRLGFQLFFLLDSLTAILPIAYILLYRRMR